MTIHVPDQLVSESTVTISISSSTRSNVNVSVVVTDGGTNSTTIIISLNDTGSGSASWTVPPWSQAIFNDNVCAQVTREIVDEAEATG